MDGDALIIPQNRLMWILERIREHLPWVRRVGTYGNTKSINRKSPEELRALKEKVSSFQTHASNYLPVKARLPKGKGEALDLIDKALNREIELRPEWMRGL